MNDSDFLTEVIYSAREAFKGCVRIEFYSEIIAAANLETSELEAYFGIDPDFDTALHEVYPGMFE